MQLWLDPTFGASGDMLLGALGGLLEEPLVALSALGRLGIDGYEVSFETVVRCGLTSTRAIVVTDDHHHDGHHHDDHHHQREHRRWSEIDALLARSDLPDRVVVGARSTFRLLGEVEAAQHDVPIDEVQFHEVGAVDAIVDIVGSWLLLDELRGDRSTTITVGPVGLGHGVVTAAHGLLPLPAPATVALLRGRPTHPLDIAFETCTPTGAALLVSMADDWGPLPAGSLGRSARGAGGKDPAAHPNVVTAIVVEQADSVEHGPTTEQFAVIERRTLLETNVDDVSPEVLGHLIDEVLKGGADDAWITPILMKKGRPAHEVKVLCRPELAARMVRLLMVETGTLGVRSRVVDRYAAQRHVTTVHVDGHEIRVKVGPFGAKPEHDDLVRVAEATGRPLRQVSADAVVEARRG